MLKKVKNKKCEGSITVFLSLILMLLLSLVLTIIEGARINTAKIYASRALTTAMDSVLAGYYSPLFEEYHIFGLDAGYGNREVHNEIVIEELEEYMSFTFEPDKGLEEILVKEKAELYDIAVKEIEITGHTMLNDHNGTIFINQAVDYMKYREVAESIERLFQKLSNMEKPKKATALFEEKLRLEEKLADIDYGILDLMQLLDGIKTGKNGPEFNRDNAFKTVQRFIKKICLTEITMQAVGINQEQVFSSLRNRYVNPLKDFESINQLFNQINETLIREDSLQKELLEIGSRLESNLSFLQEIKNKSDQTKEVRAIIREYEIKGQELEIIKKDLENQRIETIRDRDGYIDLIEKTINPLVEETKEILPLISEAQEVLHKIMSRLEVASPLISDYERSLDSQREELEKELAKGLYEGLEELKRYTSGKLSGYNFSQMKETLEANHVILSQVQKKLQAGLTNLKEKNYTEAQNDTKAAEADIKHYQISSLTLDYSLVSFPKEEQENPLEVLKDLMQEGVCGLVVDTDTLSKATLMEAVLPSVLYKTGEGKEGESLGELLAKAAENIRKAGLSELMSGFLQEFYKGDYLKDNINLLAEHLLFQEYLKEHFKSFAKNELEADVVLPTVLSYEQEYLLIGNTSDKKNIEAVIMRLIRLKTILNFVSLFSNTTKRNEARGIAVSLVGFTGLTFLVTITQMLLLLILSFAEALVDTCALLSGKSVELLKTSLELEFYELFLLNPHFIKRKASLIKDSKKPSFAYRDYLYLFLFIKEKSKVAYHAMDLIQENLRIRYEDTFTISHCSIGYRLAASFSIKPKFHTPLYNRSRRNSVYIHREYAACSY